MMKRLLFATALLGLALASGCAKGGSGPCVNNCAALNVTNTSNGLANVDQAPVATPPVTVTVVFTAAFQNTAQVPVTWTITGNACSGSATSSSNPCGYFTSTTSSTATYQSPTAVPSDPSFTVTATSQSDSSLSGTFPMSIVPITTAVSPPVLNVGLGLTQQFVAVALPDNAPQQFTWSCTANGVPCVNFTVGANGVGTASYTPVASEKCGTNCIQVSATATANTSGCSYDTKDFPCTVGQATVVSSRLSGNATSTPFSYKFSGYDTSGNQVIVAGTFTVTSTNTVSGFEDEITSTGLAQYTFAGGTYTPSTTDPANSNNEGTLALNLPANVYPNQFQVVLDGAGDVQMIESDGNGTGSGVAEPSSKNQFSQGTNQTFAFGFTGVDSSGKRVGYAGLLPTNGGGTVTGGFIDVNDNGTSSNVICTAPPCNVAGSYTQDPTYSPLWHLQLTAPVNANFDLFVANGSSNTSSPLTLYAISTDASPTTNPAVLGTMVLQNSKLTYSNAAFSGTSISVLTGANANVSLTLATTDGTSGGTGGAGNFSGQFDQNNNGTEITWPSSSTQPSFAYTYVAAYAPATAPNGRYTFQMLGNPGSSPVTPPLTFILYATGANSGFLLDQSSASVITGTMIAQTTKIPADDFAPTATTGTFALATNGNSLPSLSPFTMNLLLTSPGNAVFNVAGTKFPGAAGDVTGSYTLQDQGVGTIVLTAPGTANYIFYAVDQTHFYVIENASKDTGVASPIFYIAQ